MISISSGCWTANRHISIQIPSSVSLRLFYYRFLSPLSNRFQQLLSIKIQSISEMNNFLSRSTGGVSNAVRTMNRPFKKLRFPLPVTYFSDSQQKRFREVVNRRNCKLKLNDWPGKPKVKISTFITSTYRPFLMCQSINENSTVFILSF